MVILSSCIFSCKSSLPDGEYELSLYSHGDIHGNWFTTLPSIAGEVKAERERIGEDKVIFIDLGDHNHGSDAAYYFNHIYEYSPDEEHVWSRVADYLKYDAVVVGNHDIEAGPDNWDKIKEELDMPYLAANIHSGNPQEPYFMPYTILNKGGLKIAVIGFTTPSAKLWIGCEKKKELQFVDIHLMADSLVKHVNRTENPHFTILALHSGRGDGSVNDTEDVAAYLGTNLDGVDLILAAHDHLGGISRYMKNYVVSTDAYGKELAKAKIKIFIEDGKATGKYLSMTDIKSINTDSLIPDKIFLNHFEKEIKAADDFSSTVIGNADMDIDPKLILFGDCTYSNLLHHVQLKESGADISFVSPSKFRGTVTAGEVTYNHILQMYPFENVLYKVKLSGREILTYLEESYSIFASEAGNKRKLVGSPQNFDCAGGIRYEANLDKPAGKRIKILGFKDGRKFNIDSVYSVAMVSYRANGGGELMIKATGLQAEELGSRVIEKYSDVRELLFKFFKQGKSLKKLEEN